MIEQLNATAQGWWNWMWPMFWQVSVLIALVAVLDLFLYKRVWPQVRYALWLLIALKLMLPPALSLSTSITAPLRTGGLHMLERLGVIRAPADSTSYSLAPEPFLPRMTIGAEPVSALDSEIESRSVEPIHQTAPSVLAGRGSNVKLHGKAYLMIIWLMGVVTLVSWAAIRLRSLRRLHCDPSHQSGLPQWLGPLITEIAKKLRLRRLPKVVLSQYITSPAVFGTLRPMLVLPAATVHHVSRKRMEHILLHELAHIKRGDLVLNTVYALLQIVYWFNPLLWLVRRKLQHLREICCDATVATILKEKAMDYRETLLETAKWMLTKPIRSGVGLLGLVEDSHSLLVRLKWLENNTWKHRRLQITAIFALIVFMSACVLPMAKAQKSAEESTVIAREVDEESTKLFLTAVNDGDVEQVKLQLSIGTAINGKDRAGRTALHNAASKGYMEIAKLLIAKGADIDAKDEDDWTPLHYAARNGHADIAEVLITKGAATNTRDRWLGWKPIHRAARNGHKEIVELLLANGVDVNSGNIFRQTAAEYAMDGNRDEIVKLLISKGADVSPLLFALHMKDLAEARSLIEDGTDVNRPTQYGTTPLHKAARAGFNGIAELLIDKGADVNAKDKRGRTPLHDAAGGGHKELVELLLARGANVNVGAEWNRSPAELAMRQGHNEVAKLLISKGADISPLNFALHLRDRVEAKRLIEGGADVNKRTPYGTTPLDRAVDAGFKDIVELLIEKGANVNAKDNWNWTPLHSAVYGHKDIVELLIAKGANVNARDGDGHTPLWYAVKDGYEDIVKFLTANDADVNSGAGNWTSLHTAAEQGNTEAAKLLITKGINVNAQDWAGRTPLHLAAREGHKEFIELLLTNGANVNSGTGFNQTAAELAMADNHTEIVELLISKGADISPLHFAIYMKNRAAAKKLIEGGANVNKKTRYGTTPLHGAAYEGFKDIVALLIDKGANVNAKDNEKTTPIHNAVARGNKDIVELLVNNGTNVNARDSRGRTALWHAERKRFTEIVDLLKRHGAKE